MQTDHGFGFDGFVGIISQPAQNKIITTAEIIYVFLSHIDISISKKEITRVILHILLTTASKCQKSSLLLFKEVSYSNFFIIARDGAFVTSRGLHAVCHLKFDKRFLRSGSENVRFFLCRARWFGTRHQRVRNRRVRRVSSSFNVALQTAFPSPFPGSIASLLRRHMGTQARS